MQVETEAAAALGYRLSDRLGHVWWILLSRGVLVMLFGIAALV
jgi:hypothetical protein